MDLLIGVGAASAWALMGLVLIAVGYGVVDLVTPGKLGELIIDKQSVNASLTVASSVLALGIIITQAIIISPDELAPGLIATAGYGLLGIVMMAVSLGIVDAITPGKLREIVVSDGLHPATWIQVAANIAVGAIVAAAMT